ncbi:MAG: peptide-binding protein, partial [Epsilonproteobacteria bacterium]|nr:peptide-binding protein [Campylobacterota bacterium]NPA64577.1 peptide-binding protein [Campylobacterota bacterium]
DSIRSFYPIKSRPYLTPTTFYKSEVELLDRLSKQSDPKDYVITWWDYGYPIWYYAHLNTLIDGGKHNEDNFIVSKVLSTSDQTLAYNLSKLSIKTYVETNRTVAPQLFIKDGKPIDVESFFEELSASKIDQNLSQDIYLMFPHRMLNIFPTVIMFSQRDLNSGKRYPRHFFYKKGIRQRGNKLYIGSIMVDLQKAMIHIGNKSLPVKNFDVVTFDQEGKTHIKRQPIHDQGLSVIINQSFGEGLIVDDFYYDSLFFRLYFFDDYDKELFEPVISSPWMKIYRLK